MSETENKIVYRPTHPLYKFLEDGSTSLDQVDGLKEDMINSPKHYIQHPSGVECITITEQFNFNVGNAIKYCWRAGLKGDVLVDLKKAEYYIKREIQRISEENG